MIFQEIKKDKGYQYKCEEIFGTVTMESETKLAGDDLDSIIKTLLDNTSSAKVISGDLLLGNNIIKYIFEKVDAWQDDDENICKNTPISTKKPEKEYHPILQLIKKTLSWFPRFVGAFREAWQKNVDAKN
jgi:hypothetical protein